MKRRVAGIVLTLSLVLSLLPGPARAADSDAIVTSAAEFVAALGNGNATYSSDTVTLQNDVAVNKTIRVKNTALTLNLAGKTLNMGDKLLAAQEKGSLSVNGGGKITGGSYNGIVRAQLGGTLTVDGVTITGTAGKAAGIVAGRDGTVTVRNTRIEKVYNGIVVNGSSYLYYYGSSIQSANAGVITSITDAEGYYAPHIHIYGGEIESGIGLYLPAIGGDTTIEGGTVKGKTTGIEIRSGSLTVEPKAGKDVIIEGGGSSGAGTSDTPARGGSVTRNAGIGIAPYGGDRGGPVTVTIKGGRISGSAALYQDVPPDGGNTRIDLAVEGGQFTGAKDDRANGFGAVVMRNETALSERRFITGGAFQAADTGDESVKKYLSGILQIDAAGSVVSNDYYTITFDANGGTLTDAATATTNADGKLAKLPTDPIYEGFFFDGWYTEDGKGPVDSSYVFTKDTTVLAQWTARPKITFNAAGGTFSTGSDTVEKFVEDDYSVSIPDPPPTREGFFFKAWYTQDGRGPIDSSYEFKEDTTLLAEWKERRSVTFVPNGGRFGTSEEALVMFTNEFDKLSQLPPEPTRSGYRFEGWYTAVTGGTEITTDTVITGDIPAYARWTKLDKICTVTFNPNGGVLTGNRTMTADADGKLSQLPTPTREGYTFVGWFTAATGGTEISTDTVFTEANTTVFAHWKAAAQTGDEEGQPYTVTFDPNEGTLTGSKTMVTGVNGKLSQLPTPTRQGYTFDGWYTAAADGTKITTDTVFTKDTTVYAHWTLTPTGDYLISVSASPAEGGRVTGGGYYNKGRSVTARATAAKDYRFIYWMEDGVIISTSAAYTFTASKDRTLTAIFEESDSDGNPFISSSYRVVLADSANGALTVTRDFARPGDKVIITAEPSGGYTVGSVSVVDRDGNSIFVRDNGNGTYTFTMPASLTTVGAAFAGTRTPASSASAPASSPASENNSAAAAAQNTPSAPSTSNASNSNASNASSASGMRFDDVFSSNWFYPSVQYVYANGLMTGDGSATSFNPSGTTTRAMVWTALGRMSGADVNGGGPPWYAKARDWAVASDISDGANPTGGISRQELMTMLWRYMGSPSAAADLDQFSDREAVAAWADGAMQWAVSTGLIVGENGRLNPTSGARRSEVAAVLQRFCVTIKA